MPYDPKIVDTAGVIHALGLKEVGASDNGKWARIVLVGSDQKTEVPIHIAADLLDKMLPALLAVAAKCERRRTVENRRQIYDVRKGSIGVTTEGGIIFDFVIPTGQHYAFEMDKTGAKLLLESLSTALQAAPDQNDERDPPRRH